MVVKWFLKLMIISLVFLFLFSISIFAQEIKTGNELEDPDFKERIDLIQASQKVSEKQKDAIISSGISLYLTNFHTDQTEYKLGLKFEKPFKAENQSDDLNNIVLFYVIEGIYLENESTSLAGFLSLKATLNNRMFSPYFGIGAEFMGVADYQGFIGLSILDESLFIETKFINDEDELDSGDFYSVIGLKLHF